MSEEQNKITLVCTSHKPDMTLLEKMVISAKGFDGFIFHENCKRIQYSTQGIDFFDNKYYSIPDAYNMIIKNFVKTQWVCCFCDDDYFYPEGLAKMIAEVHKGIDADVAHFKFHISGFQPKQDKRRWLGLKEYDLWEPRPITPILLENHGRLPAGSFFRKSAWEKAGGFRGEAEHDRVLWLNMAKAGCTFKYFPYLIYNFVRRDKSAWVKQNAGLYSENT